MATGVPAWSLTAIDNGAADDNINFREGADFKMPAINNSARAMMTAVRAWADSISARVTYGGSSSDYTITNHSPGAWSSYSAHSLIALKANHTNDDTAVNVNVDGLGNVRVKTCDGGDPAIGDLVSGGIYLLAHDGTNFQIVNTVGGGSYQPLDATLTALAMLSTANGDYIRATGTDTFVASGVLLAAAGSVSAPSIGFLGDSDTGFYNDTTNSLTVTCGNAAIGSFRSAGLLLGSLAARVGNGSASAPTLNFSSSTTTGFYQKASGQVGYSAAGSLVGYHAAGGLYDANDNIWQVGGKRAVPIMAGAMKSPLTNGAADASFEPGNGMAIPVKDFDAGTQEYACFSVPMPKSWNEGTVTARFRYTGTGSGNVIWGIAAVAVSDDDALNTSLGTAQEVTDTMGSSGDQMTTAETSAITIAGSPAEGDLVCFRVYRKAADGGDTLTNDARLIAVDLFPSFSGANDA